MKISPTLVHIHHREIGGRLCYHGSELVPGLLSESEIAVALDHGWLREYASDERRSLYRLFHRFTDAKEKQPLEQRELASMTLTQ